MKYIIIGTDTEIGKTVVSSLIFKVLQEKDENPFYFKPFQTGCKDEFDKDSDAKFVYSINDKKNHKFIDSIGSIFKNPKAPYFAARDENNEVDIEKVLKKIPQNRTVLIEGSGGLNVPITKDKLLINILPDFKAKIILVARAGLGTINHTLLSIKDLENHGLKPFKIVFVDKDNQTDDKMISENMESIELFTDYKVSGCIKKIDNFRRIDEKYIRIIENLLR